MKTEETSPKWDIHTFEKAYKECVFEKRDHIEVPSEFFDVLRMQFLGGEPADAFTYGKPGVKVYREGTREAIEDEGNLDVDEYTKIQASRKQAQAKVRKRG